MSISKKILSVCCFASLSFTGLAKANLEAEVKNLKNLVDAQAKKIDALNRVGAVNIQEVFEKSSAGKKAQTEMKNLQQTAMEAMQKDQEELKKLQDSLRDPLIGKDAKEKKQAEFQQRLQAFQMKQQKLQYDLQQKRDQLMRDLFDKTKAAARKLGQAKNLYEVRNSSVDSGTLYSMGTPVDLTNDVIADLNKAADTKVAAKG